MYEDRLCLGNPLGRCQPILSAQHSTVVAVLVTVTESQNNGLCLTHSHQLLCFQQCGKAQSDCARRPWRGGRGLYPVVLVAPGAVYDFLSGRQITTCFLGVRCPQDWGRNQPPGIRSPLRLPCRVGTWVGHAELSASCSEKQSEPGGRAEWRKMHVITFFTGFWAFLRDHLGFCRLLSILNCMW